MEPTPITLIVKAPNQQIEDQTIKCELNWTINRLKQHLSEVYPHNPPQSEQKLIYSGQLLNDSVTLKDVLRHFEDQDTYTLHLVCSSRYIENKSNKKEERVRSNGLQNIAENGEQSASTSAALNSTVDRIANPNWNNNTQFNIQQFLMMQQTYVQYMQHYMNIAHFEQFGAPLPGGVPGFHPNDVGHIYNQDAASFAYHYQQQFDHALRNFENVDTNGRQVAADPDQVANGVDQAAVDPPQGAAPQQAARLLDERENHDWLDHFYMVCRMMVFISIVYFYSSAARLIVVFFTALCLYLYHIGFFRHVNLNNNHIIAGRQLPPQQEVPQPGINIQRMTVDVQPPTRFMIIWTFVTTFLTSLLPEIPNVI